MNKLHLRLTIAFLHSLAGCLISAGEKSLETPACDICIALARRTLRLSKALLNRLTPEPLRPKYAYQLAVLRGGSIQRRQAIGIFTGPQLTNELGKLIRLGFTRFHVETGKILTLR